MANDRMLLLCRCGEAVSIYKYYPDGGYETSKRRQDWIDTHMRTCHPAPFGSDLHGYVPFTLTTENSLGIPGKWIDGVLHTKPETPSA